MKRIYLDHASITPIDPLVLKAMQPYLSTQFANPSSLYREGVEMKKVLERARAEMAKNLGAQKDEIIFTAGGTEGNNLALMGLFEAAKEIIKKPHLVISEIEHPSILEVAKMIEKRGGKVTRLSVNQDGLVNLKDLQKSLTADTILVSIMYANNEIGTIQPMKEMAKVIRHYKKTKNGQSKVESGRSKVENFPYFHADASQAANYLDLNVERLGVDLMTLDGTKIYGPRGAGALFIRRRTPIQSIIFGGSQEKGHRAGTENVAAAVGLATALHLSKKIQVTESARLFKLRNYFIDQTIKNIQSAILNGNRLEVLPNIVNFCFPNLDAEFATLQFDAKGVAISSTTSCLNLQEESTSYVIGALDRKNCAKSSLRFSFGRKTSKNEIDYCLKILYNVVNGRTN